jgi:hypothetical protein
VIVADPVHPYSLRFLVDFDRDGIRLLQRNVMTALPSRRPKVKSLPKIPLTFGAYAKSTPLLLGLGRQ